MSCDAVDVSDLLCVYVRVCVCACVVSLQRYLRALSEAGTLRSARRLDRSLRQHGFLARFRNAETQICQGAVRGMASVTERGCVCKDASGVRRDGGARHDTDNMDVLCACHAMFSSRTYHSHVPSTDMKRNSVKRWQHSNSSMRVHPMVCSCCVLSMHVAAT